MSLNLKGGLKGWALRAFLPKGLRGARLGSGVRRHLRPLLRRTASTAPPPPSPPGEAIVIQDEIDWTPSVENIRDHLHVQMLIRAYQDRGHFFADLDPLGIKRERHTDLHNPPEGLLPHGSLPENFGKRFEIPNNCFIGGEGQQDITLREMVRRLNLAYCGSIGVEFAHSTSLKKSQWVRAACETTGGEEVSRMERLEALERLARAAGFEGFLAKKWSSEKRFGLEGCESLIPGLLMFVDRVASTGIKVINIGMAHRGRLNVLANVLDVPLDRLFGQFQEIEAEAHEGSGDVKYHLGYSASLINGKTRQPLFLSLVANPSHLEAIDPVVIGKTKAQQVFLKDNTGDQVMAIILHGDAAVCGQGVVFESFNLSNMPYYTTHGVLHVVINNQIGFTTDPRFSRSSEYCTDVAKVIGAPIFHVNGDDVDAVIRVMSIAARYRQKFKSDVIVDLIGYRKNGHNEADEPMLTQPLMYKKIRTMTPVKEKYMNKLFQEGVTTKEEFDHFQTQYERELETKYQEATKITHFRLDDWLDSPWDGHFKGKDQLKEPETGLNKLWIEGIASRMTQQPNIGIHPELIKIIRKRNDMVNQNKLDWTLVELVTFATLLGQGIHVRLSGRDAGIGPFNERHHVYRSVREFGKEFCPLDHVDAVQSLYSICDSSLCEYAIAGFELGYSMVTPHQLVLWECQFGDYANNAQCIIDQFLCSGESKWKRQAGVVFLLPHGMDGQGPELSSGRPERFLQLCDDDERQFESNGMKQLQKCNMIVANLSVPANLFHLLRRQVGTVFRKPLVLFTPKKDLLARPDFFSTYENMDTGTKFQRYISDPLGSPGKAKKLILCTGKAYYELNDERKRLGLTESIALGRIEQLSPFPFKEVKEDTERYKGAKLFWAQEEHRNQGWWDYVRPRILTAIGESDYDLLGYIGRKPSHAPAALHYETHLAERQQYIDEAMVL